MNSTRGNTLQNLKIKIRLKDEVGKRISYIYQISNEQTNFFSFETLLLNIFVSPEIVLYVNIFWTVCIKENNKLAVISILSLYF